MKAAGCIRVEVIRAWPRRHQTITVTLPEAATAADALAASGFLLDEDTTDGRVPGEFAGCAIFGERAGIGDRLHDGDRLELLRPLQIEPKEARRRRAKKPI